MAVRLGSLRGPQVLAVYLAGLAACYVGERLVGGESATRWITSGLGLFSTCACCLVYLWAWLGSHDTARRVERLAFSLSLLGLLALGVYLLGSDLVMGPAPVVRGGDQGPGLRQVLQVAWPILLVCSVLPLVFLQWSLASMGRGRGVEFGRVRASMTAAVSLAMLLCTLFLANAITDRKDVHTDLSYFKTTSPSESSRTLVEGLDEDTRALLFFPVANDVLAEVEPYFRELAGLSAHFSYEQVDRAMERDLAEKYRVGKEGTVVLERGGSNRKIELGEKLDSAKRKLRKLDREFQAALMKLTFKREVIYMITGHGERSHSRVEGDQRSLISILKRGIEASNFTVKRLDAVSGLSEAVPDDAAALLWVGPGAPMFPGELKSLETYLDGGGRMLLLLDPEGEHQPDGLLEFLGLRFQRAMLGHAQIFLPDSRTPADRYNIVTNKFSSHAAATTVSRHSRDLPVAMPTAGSLERAAKPGRKNRITFLVRSLPNTWADADGDFARGEDEALKVFQLAAAISRKIGGEKKKEKKKEEEKKKEKKAKKENEEAEMRVVVFADADLFADKRFKYRGNRYLLLDVLRWLLDEKRVAGAPASEEDVPVEHTRSEDVWWFYGTVFAVPLMILGLGLVTGWGRGRKRRAVR